MYHFLVNPQRLGECLHLVDAEAMSAKETVLRVPHCRHKIIKYSAQWVWEKLTRTFPRLKHSFTHLQDHPHVCFSTCLLWIGVAPRAHPRVTATPSRALVMKHEQEIIETYTHEALESLRLLSGPLGLWYRHVLKFVAKYVYSSGGASTVCALRGSACTQGGSFLPDTKSNLCS